jgi:phosphatidylglycerophosphate synthase
MSTVVDHVRVNVGVLAGAEKRALVDLARRIPSWINADHLTALGFSGMLLSGASFALSRYDGRFLVLAVLFLWVNWLGDSLDGTLARVRQHLRPRYGYYVDHVLDVFGTVALLGGLGVSEIMTAAIASVVLVAHLVAFSEIALATHSIREFRISFLRFGPTELRILLSVGALYAMYRPQVHLLGERYLLFDVGGVVAALGLMAAALAAFARNARKLYQAEPLPR